MVVYWICRTFFYWYWKLLNNLGKGVRWVISTLLCGTLPDIIGLSAGRHPQSSPMKEALSSWTECVSLNCRSVKIPKARRLLERSHIQKNAVIKEKLLIDFHRKNHKWFGLRKKASYPTVFLFPPPIRPGLSFYLSFWKIIESSS